MAGGELFESLVEIPDANVSSGFQLYSLQSEQVLSFVALECLMSGWNVDVCGGFLVQALPGLKHEELEAVTNCLESASFFEQLRITGDPIAATEAVFSKLTLHKLGVDPLAYRCTCSSDRVLGALSTLKLSELEEIKAERGQEVNCDFCGKTYTVNVEEIEILIEKKTSAQEQKTEE